MLQVFLLFRFLRDAQFEFAELSAILLDLRRVGHRDRRSLSTRSVLMVRRHRHNLTFQLRYRALQLDHLRMLVRIPSLEHRKLIVHVAKLLLERLGGLPVSSLLQIR